MGLSDFYRSRRGGVSSLIKERWALDRYGYSPPRVDLGRDDVSRSRPCAVAGCVAGTFVAHPEWIGQAGQYEGR